MKKSFAFMVLVIFFCFCSKKAEANPFVGANAVREIIVTPIGTRVIPTSPLNNSEDLVNGGKVIYRYQYEVRVKLENGRYLTGGYPCQFCYPNNGGNAVCGTNVSGFDSSGRATIKMDIRGSALYEFQYKLRDSNVKSNTIKGASSISCDYESPFYCTGYITCDEKDYSGKNVSVNGISNATFRTDFVDAVKLNGSGRTLGGQFLHYDSRGFSYLAPTTASGTSATEGKTIAVDPYYIPRTVKNGTWKRAIVDIDGIGERRAEDGGSAIKGYHIDVYLGVGKSKVKGWNNINRKVTLKKVE